MLFLKFLKIALPVAILVGVGLWYPGFTEVDACLDAGGAFNYEDGTCMMPEGETFIPLSEREGGLLRLWLWAFIVGAIPAGAVFGLLEVAGRWTKSGRQN